MEAIDESYLRGLKFQYADTILDVLGMALLRERVLHPRKIV